MFLLFTRLQLFVLSIEAFSKSHPKVPAHFIHMGNSQSISLFFLLIASRCAQTNFMLLVRAHFNGSQANSGNNALVAM